MGASHSSGAGPALSSSGADRALDDRERDEESETQVLELRRGLYTTYSEQSSEDSYCQSEYTDDCSEDSTEGCDDNGENIGDIDDSSVGHNESVPAETQESPTSFSHLPMLMMRTICMPRCIPSTILHRNG